LHFGPVVETRALEGAIVHAKAGDAYDVQRNVSRGTVASDVAGVGWYLWFDERDRQHGESISPLRAMTAREQKETTSFA
jgi:hypothetical protein